MNPKTTPRLSPLALLLSLTATACALPVESDEFGAEEGDVATLQEELFVDYSYTDISYINLSGLNREGSNFRGTTMNWARLVDTDVDGATFYGATGNYARFNNSDASGNWTVDSAASLRNTVFYGATFNRAVFNGCKMTNVYARGATLAESEFIEADLSGSGTDFYGANLARSNMKKAKFNSALIDRADFEHVNAPGAEFKNVWAYKVDFRHANLRGAKFQSSALWSSDFQAADLRGANFDGADLSGANTCNVIKDSTTSAVGAIQTGNCKL